MFAQIAATATALRTSSFEQREPMKFSRLRFDKDVDKLFDHFPPK
jgi:hypothetical protein